MPNKMTAIEKDPTASWDEMAIVEKYEAFLNYVYPKVQSCPRKHGVVRDAVLEAIVAPIPAFYAAGKSGQISRLYLIDAELATIRFWLRFLSHQSRGVLTTHQAGTALERLAEVGRMLGSWIGKRSAVGQRPERNKESDAERRPMGGSGK